MGGFVWGHPAQRAAYRYDISPAQRPSAASVPSQPERWTLSQWSPLGDSPRVQWGLAQDSRDAPETGRLGGLTKRGFASRLSTNLGAGGPRRKTNSRGGAPARCQALPPRVTGVPGTERHALYRCAFLGGSGKARSPGRRVPPSWGHPSLGDVLCSLQSPPSVLAGASQRCQWTSPRRAHYSCLDISHTPSRQRFHLW